ncbi:MAG: YolD-like family protein [Bacilli bacterium]|nr:YolD-like family protein [Bacilli bacterium]
MRWAPFNSVINSNDVMNEITMNNNRIHMPTYTEEQLEEIEYKIINAYNSKSNITLIYYKNYQKYNIDGIITKLDSIHKYITINNKDNIYFFNILDIYEKNTC